jgi:hypothetical protein
LGGTIDYKCRPIDVCESQEGRGCGIHKKYVPVRVSNFENKKLLVHPSQAESTWCKEVVTSCCFNYGRNKKARKV